MTNVVSIFSAKPQQPRLFDRLQLSRAIDAIPLTYIEKAVLQFFVRWVSEADGTMSMSRAHIIAAVGASERAMGRAMTTLKNARLIEVHPTYAEYDGSRLASVYAIDPRMILACAEASAENAPVLIDASPEARETAREERFKGTMAEGHGYPDWPEPA